MVSNEVKKSVISTWLIRSYKKQFDEYMEIKKQNEVYGLDAGMEYDPLNVDFDEWIDTDIFHFETPLCEAFKEFNQLLKIDVDSNQNGDVIYFESYEWYENLEECKLKDEALNSKAIFKGLKGVYEESSDNARTHCSPNDEWEDFERANHIRAYANSNYNPYLDVSRIFNDHAGTNNDCETQKDEGWFNEHKLMGDDDDDIGDLEDYLIQKDPPYYVNEEEERSKKRR
ncbi:hypothetical protein Tco_0273531 [Tanacetum coccineum]